MSLSHSHKKRRDSLKIWAVIQDFNSKTWTSLGGLQLHAMVLVNMASTNKECLYQDYFDAVLDIMESVFRKMSMVFNKKWIWELKIPVLSNSLSYPCFVCATFFLSKGGVTRDTTESKKKIGKLLHQNIFHKILQKSFQKLAQDEYYPEKTLSQF